MRWALVCAGTALIGTCYGFARFAYGLFAPEFQTQFQISSTVSGIIGSGSYIGYCVAIVASLVLTERLGARRIAVSAGVVATFGIAMITFAPSAPVLAAGVLIAGSSTGLASPPMAAAVSRWIHAPAQDRAQSIVNAGTGLGVLVSGPIALALIDEWRWAWAVFTVISAAVTVWLSKAIPFTESEGHTDTAGNGWRPGTFLLIAGAFLMGFSSVAMWTFGRDLVTSVGHVSDVVSTSMWAVLGAAGFVGALSGDLVARAGMARSWTTVMVAMAGATLLLAFLPGTPVPIFIAAAVFGASYVSLCGVILLWSTRIYPQRPSFGVGVSFLMIAVGQVAGAPLAGVLTDVSGGTAAFYACAAIGLIGACIRPRPS
ncbi:Predicted arabinose efflux permease, MFS family [Kibdelosporangium aridum]|uniref:Predicted arabinose efflux permease, MFS family n=1 Tax=Kibdelosporangium aridum TaxID=2030 RepID=A0A1W2FSG5_KIBAR|nr:Predicted arabinose efflux permease, MFS family [Kibdelosporangium aridum]